ncbi:MAG: RagB/SusD family nutrient uptake outer membrane protein [Bacteroidales bacterium]|jgi:hypothetical protein|nr:RagB/SusD family nutrient uptake outer membrane protein [Bacteroidales bacterium]
MKKIAFLLIPVLALVSCTKEFIERDPKGRGTDLTWFDTEDQCRMAVNAIYDPLGWQTYYQRNAEVLDMLSDEAEKGGSVVNVNNYSADQSEMYKMALYNADPTNVVANNFWKTAYIIIARANLMINRTEAKENIPAYKAMRAEARFLRAFAYMDLVKMFGPVPLVTDVISPLAAAGYGNRQYGSIENQIAETYKFIVSELEAIKGVLPNVQSGSNFGMVSDAAVRAYLAKAYLYQGDFQKAYTTARDLIGSGASLMSQYQQVFNFDNIANEGSISEIIFAVQYVNGTNDSRNYEGSIRVIDNSPRVTINASGVAAENTAVGYGLVIPTKILVSAFDATDPRLDMMAKSKETAPSGVADSVYWDGRWQKIGKMANGLNTGNYTLKNFLNQAVFNGQSSGKDYILMRWAEVLLIGAEAAVRTGNTGDALIWVNQLRDRARNSKVIEKALTMDEWTFGTSAEPAALTAITITDVKKERQRELFCEAGTRYFDLLRWNATIDQDGDNIYADYVLANLGNDVAGNPRTWNPARRGWFPININEIRAQGGSLVQNPGY